MTTVWIAEKVFDAYETTRIGIGSDRIEAIDICIQAAREDDNESLLITDFHNTPENPTLYEANVYGSEWKVFEVKLNKRTSF